MTRQRRDLIRKDKQGDGSELVITTIGRRERPSVAAASRRVRAAKIAELNFKPTTGRPMLTIDK